MDFFVTQHIEKSYQDFLALDDVSISVPEKKIFGLLGPNGAGKTTLIRIINQITAHDSGEVFFDGERLSAKHVSQIGYLPEERGLYKKMKVGEQSLYLAQLKGMSKNDAMQKLKYWFQKFEIESWWDKKVEELSKGMAQKVQFLITILHEPRLLIFDEPFSGFDPINANLLKKEILELKDKGATIIFSTHNMASVEELCDNIALINKSKKILEGNIVDIKNQYRTNIYEVQFAGSFNRMAATLTADFEILKIEDKDKKITLTIKILKDKTTNHLLEFLLPTGQITSFKEIIPSMNDVFISVVGTSNSVTE